MSPPSRQQLRAVLELRELILSGEMKPGERIPELSVVARLGMSRTPVRTALGILEHEGLLETSAGGGFVVRDFSVADVVDAIELRGVLEGTAARFAAERHTGPATLEPLSKAVRDLDHLLGSRKTLTAKFEGYVAQNEIFHARLLDLADSEMLRRAMAQAVALPFASPSAFLRAQSRAPQSLEILRLGQEHHRELLDLIAAHRGARAEALAREHALLARHNLSLVLARRELLSRVAGAALIRREAGPVPPGAKRHTTGGTSDAA